MPTKLNRAIASKLQMAQVAITNTRTDPALQAAATTFGYGSERLLEGQGRYDAALAAVDAATLTLAAQKAATVTARSARRVVQARYQTLVQRARIIFEAPELAALGLNRRGRMPRRFEEFLSTSRTLFAAVIAGPEIASRLAEYGLGAEWVNRAAEAVEEMLAADLAQTVAKADRGRAVNVQTDAVRALSVWTATYLKLARIALREQPALLEKLGVKVRVGRTAAQIAGRQKAAATRKANRAAKSDGVMR